MRESIPTSEILEVLRSEWQYSQDSNDPGVADAIEAVRTKLHLGSFVIVTLTGDDAL